MTNMHELVVPNTAAHRICTVVQLVFAWKPSARSPPTEASSVVQYLKQPAFRIGITQASHERAQRLPSFLGLQRSVECTVCITAVSTGSRESPANCCVAVMDTYSDYGRKRPLPLSRKVVANISSIKLARGLVPGNESNRA